MPVVKAPAYPKSLTVSSWNSAKGLIARITKVKTGVTEELEKAEKIFKKAPFADLDVVAEWNKQGAVDAVKMKQFQRNYLEKYHPVFKALEGTFYDLKTTLDKKASDFEKDDKLKKFAPVLKLMAGEANKFTYAVAWGTVSESNQAHMQRSIDDRLKAEKQWAEAATRVKTLIETASREVAKYKSKPITAKDYNSFWARTCAASAPRSRWPAASTRPSRKSTPRPSRSPQAMGAKQPAEQGRADRRPDQEGHRAAEAVQGDLRHDVIGSPQRDLCWGAFPRPPRPPKLPGAAAPASR